jgi:hypothetical protein
MTGVMTPRPPAPRELLDPAGEGIYVLAEHDEPNRPSMGPLIHAAHLFSMNWAHEWQNVDVEYVYMRPDEDSDEWVPASTGRFPRDWRLNLPRRWRPVMYAYCTPKPDIG